MRNIFNSLLVVLCITDTMVILSMLFISVRVLMTDVHFLDHLLPLIEGVSHVSISASVFMTVAITVERYYAVSRPHTYQIRLAKRSIKRILAGYLVPVIFASILLNIPKILHISGLLDIIFEEHKTTIIEVGMIFQIVHPLTTTCIIPIILFIVLNY